MVNTGDQLDWLVERGLRIRYERIRLGLTQEEAGRKANVTRGTWGNWENGRTPMDTAAERKFAELGANIKYIRTGHHADRSENANNDNREEDLLMAFRASSVPAQNALLKISRTLTMADEKVETLAHVFCRAVVERLDLTLASTQDFGADEQNLITLFRDASPRIRGVFRQTCNIHYVEADDVVVGNGYSPLEEKIAQFYRGASPGVKTLLLNLLISERNIQEGTKVA